MICDFISKRDAYYKSEGKMVKHFRKKIKIENIEDKNDLIEIKKSLITMPECAGKVLIFRSLIIREKEL